MPKVIAALTLNHIGDVLFTEPAIAALRAGYINARLVVLTSSEGKAVLGNHPAIDEILVRRRGMKGWLQAAQVLRSQKPDLVVNFSPSSIGLALCSFLSGARERFGFAFRPIVPFLFTTSLQPNPKRHFVDDCLALAGLAGGKVERCQPQLFVTDEERLRAQERLRELGWDIKKPLWGFHPFSSVPLKEWNLENYAELINLLRKSQGFVPIVFGSASERKRAQRLAQMVQVIVAAGVLSLREFIATVTWCDTFIGSDSGPTHIAAALCVPTVALFGPTDPKRFGPLGKRVLVIQSPTNYMNDLSVSAVQEVLQQTSPIMRQ